jgi:mediator of RNA polymerase II transcription subunit 31
MSSSDVAMTDPKEQADAASEHDLPDNRFELELEFVQCLASPAYLHHLATTGILGETSFIEFLKYLQYWKQPEYVRLLQYPHCLFFLDLLINNTVFRRELANVSFRNFIHEQQFYNWQHRARNLYGQGLPPEDPP